MGFLRFGAAFSTAGVLASVALLPSATHAQGQDGPTFTLELNDAAETETGSCRLTYVASNLSDVALERTAYEVAVFDAGGVVNRILVLEFGSLIEGKTKVLRFDLAETACADISRIVVNDVSACLAAASGATSDVCMSGLETSSQIDAIQFGL